MKCTFKAVLIILFIAFSKEILFAHASDTASTVGDDQQVLSIYQKLKNDHLSIKAFLNAYKGYLQLIDQEVINKKNLLSIIDFNKSSKEERFFIIDLSKPTIIHESLVAHGKNSGWDIPTSFSNIPNTNKSSLGSFLTGETYFGKHGLSLMLDGLERGINDLYHVKKISFPYIYPK